MSEPRVLWIPETYQEDSPEERSNHIKFIEHSAYETLRTENEWLHAELKNLIEDSECGECMTAAQFAEVYEKQLQSEREKNAVLENDLRMCREIGVEMQREVNRKQTIELNAEKEKVTKLRNALEKCINQFVCMCYGEGDCECQIARNPCVHCRNKEAARSVLAEIGDEK